MHKSDWEWRQLKFLRTSILKLLVINRNPVMFSQPWAPNHPFHIISHNFSFHQRVSQDCSVASKIAFWVNIWWFGPPLPWPSMVLGPLSSIFRKRKRRACWFAERWASEITRFITVCLRLITVDWFRSSFWLGPAGFTPGTLVIPSWRGHPGCIPTIL